jgi:mono/diheme cytochrome c family protein
MSLLMPELERQLRAAARAQLAEASLERRWSRRVGAVLTALAATAAIAVAVSALLLFGHRHRSAVVSPPPAAIPGASANASGCGPLLRESGRDVGLFVDVASGRVDGRPWRLQAAEAGRGVGSFLFGAFVLGGHRYGFCSASEGPQLIDALPHGVVYGFITGAGNYKIDLHLGPAASHATVKRLAGGTFFVQALPRSACSYKTLTLTATAAAGTSRAVTQNDVATFGDCKPWRLAQVAKGFGSRLGPGSPSVIPVQPPPGLSPAGRAEFLQGRTVAAQAGCLACHQIGGSGNAGPGPNLTSIGRRLSSTAIRNALLNPTRPMPSFRGLPQRALRQIVQFLSELRTGH